MWYASDVVPGITCLPLQLILILFPVCVHLKTHPAVPWVLERLGWHDPFVTMIPVPVPLSIADVIHVAYCMYVCSSKERPFQNHASCRARSLPLKVVFFFGMIDIDMYAVTLHQSMMATVCLLHVWYAVAVDEMRCFLSYLFIHMLT